MGTKRQKHRNETHRTSTKKDDHSSYRDKKTSRPRSRSKDSNDGYNNQKNKTNNTTTQYGSYNQSTLEHSNDNEASCSNSGNDVSGTEAKLCPELAPQPVVIDKILSGHELDLKSFIDINRENPVISSINKSLNAREKCAKSRVAAKIFEVENPMKIRTQIELSNQKKFGK